ncbi:hypothetical protein [Roseivirga seohaensis]|nr:hypothetical protein [Roseivirga seohaensis]
MMDIRKQLLKEHSKENTNLIVSYVAEQQERFDALMNLFLSDEYRVTQRAAWVVGEIGRKKVEMLKPHLKAMVFNLKQPNLHDSIKRNTVRVLQELEIPESLWGEVADICFGYLASKSEAIAIKCFSMTVLLNITYKVPELKDELQILIEDQMPYGSSGFKSRGKRTLKALEKIQ